MSEVLGDSSGITAPRSATVRWRRQIEAIVPAIIVCVFAFSSVAAIRGLFFHVGWVDPWIYTALIENYSDIVDRYGSTYYAARIGHILPAIAFDRVFGEHLGVLMFHASLLSLGGYVLFRLVSRLYGRIIGLAAAAAYCYGPWLLSTFAYDMYEGTALTFLFVACICALTPNPQARWLHFLAGMSLGIATNVTTFVVGLFVFFGIAWLVAQRRRGWRECGLLVGLGLAGFLTSTLAINILLRLMHATWQANDPTLAVVAGFMGGGLQPWNFPFSTLFEIKHYVFAAPVVAAIWAATALFLRPRAAVQTETVQATFEDRLKLDCKLAIAVMPLAWFGHHLFYLFFLNFNAFAWPHYLLYLLIPTVLACAVAVGETARGPVWVRWATFAAISLPLAMAQFFSNQAALDVLARLDLTAILVITGMATVGAAALLIARQRAVAAVVYSLAAAFVLLLPNDINQIGSLRTESPVKWDLRDGARHLVAMVAKVSPPANGRVGFFYRLADHPLSSIQSAHLWGYSRAFSDADLFPEIDSETIQLMANFDPIVVLASDANLMNAALLEFKEHAGVLGDPVVIERGRFQGEVWGYDYAVVNRTASPIAASEGSVGFLPTTALNISTAASMRIVDGSSVLDSHPSPGAWSATFNIPEEMRRPGPGYVRIWLQVEEGGLQILPVKADDGSAMVGETVHVAQSEEPTVVAVPIHDLSAPTTVVLANGSQKRSHAVVHAIEVVSGAPSSPAAEPPSGENRLDITKLRTDAMWAPAAVRMVGTRSEVTSYPGPGGWSAMIDIPESLRRSGPGVVRIQLEVTGGAFELWAAEQGRGEAMLSQKKIAAKGPETNLDLRVDDMSKPAIVMFVNGSANGASTALVRSIAVLPAS